jgi:hypothetical protein
MARRTRYAASLALLLLAAVAAGQPTVSTYVIGRAGASFPAAPGGYVLASLKEIQGGDFAQGYNPYGVQITGGESDSWGSVPGCSLIGVAEGLLATGPASNVSLIAPYNSGGTWESGSDLTSSVFFGYPNGAGFIGAITTQFQSGLYTVPSDMSDGYCNTTAYWAIYRAAVFTFGRTGSDYPSAPSSDPTAVLASIHDLSSPNFVYQYNAQALAGLQYPSGSAQGCCAVKVQEGWVVFNRSFVVPHFETSGGDCACSGSGFDTFSGNQRLATRWGGMGTELISSLNVSSIHEFGTTRDGPSQCDSQPSNAFAIFKSGPNANPAPALYNCWEIDLRFSYYTPSGGSCIADQWRYDINNASVQDIQLTDFDTCGSSETAYGFSISTFNTQYASVSLSSLSSCGNCTADGVLIPMQTGSEMSTVCDVTLGEFGFCELLVQIDRNYPCETPSPLLASP